MKVTVIPIVIGCTRNNPQRIGKGTWRLGNERTSRDHPDYIIIKIGKNTEKSPGDLRRLVVIQTPAENHQLTLVRTAPKGIIIMIIIILSKQYQLQITILNINNLLFYGFKYLNLIPIIFKQIYWTHRWDSNSYSHSKGRVDMGIIAMEGWLHIICASKLKAFVVVSSF